ncbi:hypothetical protein BJY04DRAFT_212766 [Aspergillus karnatakaensis]|uniref:uncharacterized protein n=1 Tax=Aspergillus karnatakaensis TaxID=1810916 RepID=UPI003CCD0859
MASGFEVAGLALALFPILVEGLKLCVGEKGTIKDFLHYKHVVKRLLRDLAREQTIFRNSCQRFLKDVAYRSDLAADTIEEMMQDLDDPRWNEGSWLQPGLFDLESVQRYLETVEDIHEELSKLATWIGIQPSTSPQVLDKKTRRRQWKKLVLVIRQDEIFQSLERVSYLNSCIARLTEQARPTAPTHHPHRRRGRHYKQIRSRAIDLYRALYCQFPSPPSCKCALRHQVNIRLEFRSARKTDKTTSFHTIFTFRVPETSQDPAHPWREIELEHWESEEVPKTATQQSQSLPRRVGFSLQNTTCSASTTLSYPEIQDLCFLVSQSRSSSDWFGFIPDGSKNRHRLRDIHPHQILSKNIIPPHTISLAQAFASTPPSREYRSRLGLKLASSVMQLHTTEWLLDSWGAGNIYFLQSVDGSARVNDPFVQRIFGAVAQAQSSTEPNKGIPTISRSIPCLFSLGVVLN